MVLKQDWYVSTDDDNGNTVVRQRAGGYDPIICDCCCDCGIPYNQITPNARLMAAAPDLLESLTVLVADVENAFVSLGVGHMQAETVLAAKKAIAKATGQD